MVPNLKIWIFGMLLLTVGYSWAQEQPSEKEDDGEKPKTEKKISAPALDNKPSLTEEQQKNPDDALMKAGFSLDTAKKYKEAARLYKQAIRSNKENAAAYLKLAIDYYEQLALAIHIKPDFADAYIKRAEYETEAGQYKAAGEDLKKAIEAEPNNKMGYYQRGILLQKTHKLTDAINDFAVALDLDRYFGLAYIELGHTRYINRDYHSALIDLGKGEAIVHKDFKLFKYTALCKMAQRDLKGAIELFEKALEINPYDTDVLTNIALAKINTNDYKGALDDCNRGVKLKPKDEEFFNFRGVAKSGLKDNKGALQDLDKSISIKPDYSQAYVNRAAVKFAMGDKRGACQDLYTADGMANEMAGKLVDKYCKKKLN